MTQCFDAVIVGGGPAGSMSGLYLARLGWSVAIIERRHRFQSKTCGHCLNQRAISLLQGAGLEQDVRNIAVGLTRRLKVNLQAGGELDSSMMPLDSVSTGLLVERGRFDQLLLDAAAAAGATLIQPVSARIVRRSDDEVLLDVVGASRRMQLETRLVVGADGLGSAIARSQGLTGDRPAGRAYGFAFDLANRERSPFCRHAVHMFIARSGYLGVVIQNGGRLHVAGLIRRSGQFGERDPLRFVRQMGRCHEQLRAAGLDRIQADDMLGLTAAGPMPWRPRRIADASIALVGDAAGYVEPFTGEGMSWAIQSAAVLARILEHAAPGCWNRSLAQRYRRAWKREISRRQRVCRVVGFALVRPRLTNLFGRLGAGFPSLTHRIVRQAVAG